MSLKLAAALQERVAACAGCVLLVSTLYLIATYNELNELVPLFFTKQRLVLLLVALPHWWDCYTVISSLPKAAKECCEAGS